MRRMSLFIIVVSAFFTNPVFAIKDQEDGAPYTRVNPPPIRVADSPFDLPMTHSPCIQDLEFPNESEFALLSIQYEKVLQRQSIIASRGDPVIGLSNLLRSYVDDINDAIRDSQLEDQQKQYWRTILAHRLDANVTVSEVRAYIKDLAELNSLLIGSSNYKIKKFLGAINEIAIANEFISREDTGNTEQDRDAFETVKKTIDALRANKSVREKLAKAIPAGYGKSAELMEEAVLNLQKLAELPKLPERIRHLIMVLECRHKVWLDVHQAQSTPTNELLVRDLFYEMLIYIHEIENSVAVANTVPAKGK